MNFIERWRQRGDRKEISKIFEIAKNAQKRWDDSFTTASLRTIKIQDVYNKYGLSLTEQDYRYITCFSAYYEAIKTETPLSRMEPDALALRAAIEQIKREKIEEATSRDAQMDGMDITLFASYASHVAHISHTAMEISKLSSVPQKPREFFLATATDANMLIQIRNGTITGVK